MPSNTPEAIIPTESSQRIPAPKKRWVRRLRVEGNALRIEQRRKKVERFLLGDAAALRREAAHLEFIAKKLSVDREAGRDPDKMQLLDAVRHAPATKMNVNLLFGLPYGATAEELHDAAFGRLPRPQIVDQPPVAAKPEPITTTMSDPLAEATAIARSAACDEIDWSREPLTDRERRVRAKLLENILSEWLPGVRLTMMTLELLNHRPIRRPASDLAAAIAKNKQWEIAHHQRKNAETIRLARQAVDAEQENDRAQ